jgi:hypothetical protein
VEQFCSTPMLVFRVSTQPQHSQSQKHFVAWEVKRQSTGMEAVLRDGLVNF